MSIKDRLTDDMKAALRAGEKDRLGTIRMALAAIKQREVDERIELGDAELLATMEKLVKQRRESIRMYREGKREDLAAKEEAEIEVLSAYLPEPLGPAELERLVDSVIESTGATSVRDMGKVMAAIKQQAQGRADMGAVSGLVKSRLSS